MNELEIQEILQRLIGESDGAEEVIDDVRTFDDEGMLTRNKGLVVSLQDGSEFQITIVKSK